MRYRPIMPLLSSLSDEARRALEELAGRLRHDLGRYVAFQARWLPPDATPGERLQALRDDVLATRRGPDGATDAFRIWEPYDRILRGQAPLAEGLVMDLTPLPQVRRIQDAIETLAGLRPGLEAGDLPPEQVEVGLDAARAIATACRRLHTRVREARDHG
jgi:hypothetical protein